MRYFLLLNILLILFSCSSEENEDTENPIETIVTTNDFTVTINENPNVNQILGLVQGSTNTGSLTFELIEEFPQNSFIIDTLSGQLSVRDQSVYDFETNPIITGKVKIGNGFAYKVSNITIKLNNLNDPHVYAGDIALLTQLEINSFGVNNYTEITGELRINSVPSNYQIITLTPLSSLTEVGSLNIQLCSNLRTLEGLNNLTAINNNLLIDSPGSFLEDISALSNLNTIENNLFIGGAYSLKNITCFSKITELNGFLEFDSNDSLLNLEGLDNLKNVNGYIRIEYNLNLQNIEGLSNLENIGNYFNIEGNQLLANLNPLENLISVSGNLKIERNFSLVNFCGISNLIQNNGLAGLYEVSGNVLNPSKQDIIDGNCN
jgi:hypothetical protein